ncbi:hypothetical protein [Halobacterium salinarum]|uniref:Uncharacterized protein n=2 Tax=Halobacterium TaxID=2239 RepID=A0A4D6GWT5_HALS9|nr:hypothetical protein [Halobacterium salinarum]QRY23658.1 hypothetical protein JT689_06430 [Halobacterium sp. GSL-19]MDL0136837.1 hypothetical protein [Halobacterium salinarum]MDL0144841.1 hypothetical protein [Halobacterium salinarum]QCC45058.1 uncharacterized protein HBSAL_07025 [Halobacterium salinarum]TYO76170.1 hypothetical protein APQ99_01727 [Halobacterium salinarum DSM 3754]
MVRDLHVPRTALLAVGLAVLLVAAGCTGMPGGSSADATTTNAKLDSVPASAEYVAYVDVAGMRTDTDLRSVTNTTLAEADLGPSAPSDVSSMLDDFEEATDINPRKIQNMTMFTASTATTQPGTSSGAALLSTTYDESGMVNAIESSTDTTLNEGTYGNVTVYSDDSLGGFDNVLAALGDGEFVVGDRDSVESMLDVRSGDADHLEGDLRSAFEGVNGGSYVQYALSAPNGSDSLLGYERVAENAPVNLSAVSGIEYTAVSFGTDDGDITSTEHVIADSEDSAERAYDLIDGTRSLYASVSPEELRPSFEAGSIEQDGNTVIVTYAESADTIESRIEAAFGTNETADNTTTLDNSSAASVARP